MRTRLIRLIDRLAPLLYRLIGKILRTHAFLGPQQMPNAHRALDRWGIACLPYHYYQPVYNPADLPEKIWTQQDPLLGVEMNTDAQLALLAQFDYNAELAQFLLQPPHAANVPGRTQGFYHRNGMYENGDAEILYSMIRHFQPARMIEVGSGFSTKLARCALARNQEDGKHCRHLCIEPYENPWLEALDGIEVLRQKVEDVDDEAFQALGAGDILFLDSSHVLRTGGDVFYEYLRILPSLNPGVLVHIHDIFLPFDYPRSWVVDRRSFWTEQYLLQAFLAFNTQFEVVIAVNYLAHFHPSALLRNCPSLAGESEPGGGAFWLRRK